jgi:hypothetical protein
MDHTIIRQAVESNVFVKPIELERPSSRNHCPRFCMPSVLSSPYKQENHHRPLFALVAVILANTEGLLNTHIYHGRQPSTNQVGTEVRFFVHYHQLVR